MIDELYYDTRYSSSDLSKQNKINHILNFDIHFISKIDVKI